MERSGLERSRLGNRQGIAARRNITLASKDYASSAVLAAQPRQDFRKRSERVLGPDWRVAWLFFAPTLILLFALVGWPFVQGVYLSFTNTVGSTVKIGPWVGL